MIRSLWIAKTGLDAQQTNLDVIANNLANASTTGFKRVKPMFEDLLYQTLRAAGANSGAELQIPTGLQVGAGVRLGSTERVLTQGALMKTENPLDIAINGIGYFQVQLPDGTAAYTRDGNFARNSQGQMVTQSGMIVAPGITIPNEALSVSISEAGEVSVVLPGDPRPVVLGEIPLVTFVNRGGLAATGGNLFVETAASGPPIPGVPGSEGFGALLQSYSEASNVNVAEELIALIQAQRGYELNSRAVKASDEMLQRVAQL
jgi:flagellar basal-body rod protein FlgG